MNYKVYAFGSNTDAQLGINNRKGIVWEYEPVVRPPPEDGDGISRITGGGRFTLLLTTSGQLWVCGYKHDLALGCKDPVRIENIRRYSNSRYIIFEQYWKNVVFCAATETVAAFVIDHPDGHRVVTQGFCRYGELGRGRKEDAHNGRYYGAAADAVDHPTEQHNDAPEATVPTESGRPNEEREDVPSSTARDPDYPRETHTDIPKINVDDVDNSHEAATENPHYKNEESSSLPTHPRVEDANELKEAQKDLAESANTSNGKKTELPTATDAKVTADIHQESTSLPSFVPPNTPESTNEVFGRDPARYSSFPQPTSSDIESGLAEALGTIPHNNGAPTESTGPSAPASAEAADNSTEPIDPSVPPATEVSDNSTEPVGPSAPPATGSGDNSIELTGPSTSTAAEPANKPTDPIDISPPPSTKAADNSPEPAGHPSSTSAEAKHDPTEATGPSTSTGGEAADPSNTEQVNPQTVHAMDDVDSPENMAQRTPSVAENADDPDFKLETLAGFQPIRSRVVDFAAGVRHFVAVLDNGDVYGWGQSSRGQLGGAVERPFVAVPTNISNAVGFKAVRAVCGRDWTLVVGDPAIGLYRLLCIADRNIFNKSMPTNLRGWKDIGATWGAAFILFQDGKLEGWGNHPLGTKPPSKLPLIKTMACGTEHVLALTRADKLYAWGWSVHGNCGRTKKLVVEDDWVEIKPPKGEVFRGVAAGYATSFAITSPPYSLVVKENVAQGSAVSEHRRGNVAPENGSQEESEIAVRDSGDT